VHDWPIVMGGTMSGRDTDDATRGPGAWRPVVSRLAHWGLVTLGARRDAREGTIRALTLAIVVGVAFALFGTINQFAAAGFVTQVPINLDLALRALSLGWFESDRTLPITIVEIDADTMRDWNSPAITPRGELARLLQVITAASPAAVVVDIDLSWGERAGDEADAGTRVLREFLRSYAGPAPIVFPKRIEVSVDGTRRLPASPIDDVFERNSRLAWAHASFETDGGGVVRNWQDWLAVCADSGAAWLPSVPVRLAAMVAALPEGLARPVPPATPRHSCMAPMERGGKERRLLVGPRLTGERRAALRADAQSISASLLLDPALARNDARLFGGRYVFVGATHASAGDFWLTPSGVLPGVELLANTVRFAPLQPETEGWAAQFTLRLEALLLYAIFAFSQWRLRGLVALALSTACALALVALAIDLSDDVRVFDAVEAAILLMVAYKALEALLKFIAEARAIRGRFPGGIRGSLRALGAACIRDHGPSLEGDRK